MARKKSSGAVITIGILHLVMGVLGLILSLFMVFYLVGLFAVRAGQPVEGAPVEAHLVRVMPSYITVMLVKTLIGLVLSLALLAAGIGLLLHHKWGRYVSIGYGVASILTTLIFVIYHLAIVNPATRGAVEAEAQRQMPNKPANQQGFVVGAMYAGPCTNMGYLVYPLVVLIVMYLPTVKEAFDPPARKRRRARDEEDEDIEEDDYEEAVRPRRRRRSEDEDDRGFTRRRDRGDEDD